MKDKIILRTLIIFLAFAAIENKILSQNNTISKIESLIKIKEIKISGQSIFQGKYPELKKEFENSNSITLKSELNSIEIFWDIIDNERKETDFYIYSYILHGYDKEWTISDMLQAKYSSLSLGTYKFEVKCFRNGIMNEAKSYNLLLKILPEFHMTWQFYFLYLIGITLIIIILFKIKLNINLNIELMINLISWATLYATLIIFNLAEEMDDIVSKGITFSSLFADVFLIPDVFRTFAFPFVIFYLFYLLIVPKFLFQKKYLQFALFAVLSIFIISYLYQLSMSEHDSNKQFAGYLFFSVLFAFFGGLTKKLVLWRKSVAEKTVLFKKLYANKSALLMLQAQLNPHFLFNSLNNIDILVEENPKTASDYLKKLSDILRYVLYETKETETELLKEIDQIKSYIELQKIRTDNPHYVNFNIIGELKDQKIAPMIFIPFVENAFKHCKNKTVENAIDIEFELNSTMVKMICNNYYEESQIEIIKNEGMGIETIKQRLNLLYPKNHELKIEKTQNWFNVSLSINLNDNN